MAAPAKEEFERTSSLPKCFELAFKKTGLKVKDFAYFMNIDTARSCRIRKQENMQTDTAQKAAAFFGMPMSEFIKLGE